MKIRTFKLISNVLSAILQFNLFLMVASFLTEMSMRLKIMWQITILKKLSTGTLWAGNLNVFAQASVLALCFEPQHILLSRIKLSNKNYL